MAQTATSESPPYSGKIVPPTGTDWAPGLPAGPDGAIALSDYQRDWSRFAPTYLRKYGQSWPEDHCVANLGSARSAAMHLFSSDSIGSHNYFNSHPSKPLTGGSFAGNASLHSHLQLSAQVPHLMHSSTDSLNNSYNGIRPIIDSQSCHTLPDINDNRLLNGCVSVKEMMNAFPKT